MSGRVFHHTHRVAYGECTVGNHVYHARYLDMLESARGDFFRALQQALLDWQARDIIFPVIECRLRYKSAARYDDLLAIELRVSRLVRIQVAFAYRILDHAGRILVEATTDHVCTNIKSRPKRIPTELAEALRPYLNERNSDGAN